MNRRIKKSPSPIEDTLRYCDRLDPKWIVEGDAGRMGRGVFTASEIKEGEFVLQYAGKVISAKRGNDLENTCPSCYRFFFSSQAAVVSRLLSAVENGCINKWRGQNLADINYDEIPVLQDVDDKETAETSTSSSSAEISSMTDPTHTSSFMSTECSASQSIQSLNETDGSVLPANSVLTSSADYTSSSTTSNSVVHDRRGLKRRWNEAELSVFNRVFKQNIADKNMATGNELMCVQEKLIPTRTIAQIRTRLNNVILGKQNQQ